MILRRYFLTALLSLCVASSPIFAKLKKTKSAEAEIVQGTTAKDPSLTTLDAEEKSTPSKSYADSVKDLSPEAEAGAPKPETSRPLSKHLSTGDNALDLQYYKDLDRKLGVNLGMLLPFGDLQTDFSTATALGIHYTWAAMAPFSFSISTLRASCTHKNGPASGKLSVTSFGLGAIGSFPSGRFIPFIRLEAALNFMDVSFDANRTFTSGHDSLITSVGANFGIGWDFVVGRELSLGIDATYHYSVPKKAMLSTGTSYDLGSSYATATLRVSF